jgi:hypothetical protein
MQAGSEGKHGLLLNEPGMLTRLLKAYVRRPEHDEYLQLVLGKSLKMALNINEYLSALECVPSLRSMGVRRVGQQKRPQYKTFNPASQLAEDAKRDEINSNVPWAQSFIYQNPGMASPTTSLHSQDDGVHYGRDSSFANAGHKRSAINPEATLTLCGNLIQRIIKKLPYIPLGIRYVCRLLADVMQVEVLVCSSMQTNKRLDKTCLRKVIMDLLFQKLWCKALMRPVEHLLVPVCVTDDSFSKQMVAVSKLLQATLNGRPLEGTDLSIAKFNKFIADHQ